MRIAITMLFCAFAAACGRDASGSPAGLRGGAPSVRELGAAVVTALAAGDTAALQAMRTTEQEHNELLWPHFPIAKQDTTGATRGFAWENIQLRNGAAAGEWTASFRGRQVRFDDARCTGQVEEYGPFQILRECSVTVTDVARGRAFELRPFDRVVRMNGVHKVIRYVEVD
ncbi:MAG TPA: hypothetical protein VE871_07010 [Longimicrobium sp.]|nr:hypothetical protein [Longimicrobium sp.]